GCRFGGRLSRYTRWLWLCIFHAILRLFLYPSVAPNIVKSISFIIPFSTTSSVSKHGTILASLFVARNTVWFTHHPIPIASRGSQRGTVLASFCVARNHRMVHSSHFRLLLPSPNMAKFFLSFRCSEYR
ncbi:unnamed protein product, partial [Ectocarpus sp. 13 AM-2016]